MQVENALLLLLLYFYFSSESKVIDYSMLVLWGFGDNLSRSTTRRSARVHGYMGMDVTIEANTSWLMSRKEMIRELMNLP